MTIRIDVDRARCAGLGICESVLPDVFEVDDTGELQLRRAQVEDALRDRLQEAVDGCPTGALRLVDGGLVPPAG